METKRSFKFFTIYEHEKEQDYLRQMHRSGWKFHHVSGLGVYHFTRCTPQDVVYQLDYRPAEFGSRDEYLQLLRDCGWEYLQDYFGYSYFRKPVDQITGPEEIFGDSDSKKQMLARVFKGRLLPLVILFLCVILPGFWVAVINRVPWMILLYGGLLGAYGVLFILFGWLWYRQGR